MTEDITRERLARIRASLDKINSLMAKLKDMPVNGSSYNDDRAKERESIESYKDEITQDLKHLNRPKPHLRIVK